MKIARFEDMPVWQTARLLTQRVYAVSAGGPFARDFGLRDQIRRASVSIMSNIAEGFESRTQAMFVDFLGRAKGSAGEVRAQLYVASDAGYLDQAQFRELYELAESCSRQLRAFMTYLECESGGRRLREGEPEYAVDIRSEA
ncbi:MAG: four helix bundle protein [Anaerolineae bacterium]|jgi:four helix bundle protein|nr:four helix bundle protein [Anaerolineae bacterium]